MGAVEWVFLTKDTVSVGDLVSADAGGMPIYRVVAIAIAEGRAWVQDEHDPAVHVMPLERFLWKAASFGDGAA